MCNSKLVWKLPVEHLEIVVRWAPRLFYVKSHHTGIYGLRIELARLKLANVGDGAVFIQGLLNLNEQGIAP